MTEPLAPRVLDGRALATRLSPQHARRAAAVAARRGRPPRLLLLAFGDERDPPRFMGRKLRACADAGVEVVPLVPDPSSSTDAVAEQLRRAIAGEDADGVFIEFPFPAGIDGDALVAEIPAALDVDVMTESRIRGYLDREVGPPPVTVEAALLLLDAADVPVAGRDGVVLAEPSPFAEMFRTALARRGARMRPVQPPPAGIDLARRAGLVVAAAARPGLLRADELAPGAVVIDAGYFNPGGGGDVDPAGGTDHLAAFAPVPGGIGPATVTALVGRVIAHAEERAAGAGH